MITLHSLHPSSGSRKGRKRVGRGPGSGHGKTASRGHKGAKSRSGGSRGPGFEGGQMPLQRRLPKRGFRNAFKIVYQVVNIEDLNTFTAHTVVTPALLQQEGKIKTLKKPVKLLGRGEITFPLTVQADKFSQAARHKIAVAGGTAEETSS